MKQAEQLERPLAEKWRPVLFEDFICNEKDLIFNYLKSPKNLPSFIFYGKAGTGKTTCAKLIAKKLGCDFLRLNASEERGVDTIREKVKGYVQSMSMLSDMKRCVFLDEADGLTSQALESMKVLIEDYSENAFFILACNNLAKIIDPIQSRCVKINFDRPSKLDILMRLEHICEEEGIKYASLDKLIDTRYPDIRSMIVALQSFRSAKKDLTSTFDYGIIVNKIEKADLEGIYKIVFESDFDCLGFTRYYFKYLFDNYERFSLTRCSKCAIMLAEVEKSANMNLNVPIIFMASIANIINILKENK